MRMPKAEVTRRSIPEVVQGLQLRGDSCLLRSHFALNCVFLSVPKFVLSLWFHVIFLGINKSASSKLLLLVFHFC